MTKNDEGKGWCLHCEVSKLIQAQVEKLGEGNLDFNGIVADLIQVLGEIACSAEDAEEWGKEICAAVLSTMAEMVKEELLGRQVKEADDVKETKH